MAKTKPGQKNKLSKLYRLKKKTGKIKKFNRGVATKNHQARIVVRNLSYQATEEQVRKLFQEFGQIDEVSLLKRPDGTPVGCGFVQFQKLEEASKAIFKTNKTEFLGRPLNCEFAIKKSDYVEKIRQQDEVKEEEVIDVDDEDEEVKQEGEEEDVFQKLIVKDGEEKKERKTKKVIVKKQKSPEEIAKIREQRKLKKTLKQKKRARIIVRNLPFSANAEQICETFSKYGKIEEVRILKKPNNKPLGCCFLQFEQVNSAQQAINNENLKDFHGRQITVDWAIAKDKFEKQKQNQESTEVVTIKEEEEEQDGENEIKEEIIDDEIKEEDGEEEEEEKEMKQKNEVFTDESENEEQSEDEVSEAGQIKSEPKEEVRSQDSAVGKSHPKRISNDVSEGKTVFIKNVPFSAKNEDLKACMEQFGPVYYALICMDPLTEHSKGTAFVKFQNKEDAEKCLSAGTELKLLDEILDPHPALHRREVLDKKNQSKHNAKDNRNLYLVKEGVVLANSKAAEGVSASDIAIRLRLEQWKSQMLRNLNMFVSRIRLVVHNLPPNLDDNKLRQIFKKYSDSKAVITEARVMRDLKNLDSQGNGQSKGHGFVSFTSHEDALRALRKINNNPNIFSHAKRPIVAFAIENRVMTNAKKRRLEKSRENNPLYKSKQNNGEGESLNKSESKAKKRKKSLAPGEEQLEPEFSGITSKPGDTKFGNSKFFVKKQAIMHRENLKEDKKKSRQSRKRKADLLRQKEARSEKMKNRLPKAMKIEANKKKKAKNVEEKNFDKMVNDYRSKLSSVPIQKSKWYEAE